MRCSENAQDISLAERNKVIFRTSWLNVAANLLLSATKIAIGLLTNSIAIVSEGVNNASDMATSVITMVGTKLSQKRPTKKHPFGYGRIEFLTSLLIGTLILFTGIELLKSSVGLILHPEEPTVSYLSLAVLLISLVVKLGIGIYTIARGRKVKSTALVAVGEDSRSDSIVSAITIASVLFYLFFHHSIDAWAGLLTSLFVLKAAWEVLKDTIAALLGQPADKEFADKIYALVRSNEYVINAVDMTIHNYGPNSYTGSVNIEVDYRKSVGEVYASIHALQLQIMREYNVTLVFGMYAVNQESSEAKEIRHDVVEFVRKTPHVLSYHAIFKSPASNDLYCDFIVDYDLKDWDSVRNDFVTYMKAKYPQFNVILTIETEFV